MTTSLPSIDLTIGGVEDNILSVLGSGGRAVFLSDSSLWMGAAADSPAPILRASNKLLLQNVLAYTVPEPTSLVLLGALAIAGVRRSIRPA
jgi:hypothetical protein